MASYLEAFPSDILENIALLTAIGPSPTLNSLGTVLALLQTSSTLYHNLCMRSCPHLYADIFRNIFDTKAIVRRFRFHVTDSALAKELVMRCDMLRRVRRQSRQTGELRKDLWTAFCMIQESDGLNEAHLRDAHFPEYLLDTLKHWDSTGEEPSHELRFLVIWLLCSTLTRQHICSLPPETVKVTLPTYLLPYCRIVHGHAYAAINSTGLPSRLPLRDQTDGANQDHTGSTELTLHEVAIRCQQHGLKHEIGPIVRYGREWVLDCLDSTPAAINLLFSLKEIDIMSVPEHLPETRSIALATQRSGPTREDVIKIRGYKTMLLADTLRDDCHHPVSVPRYGSRSEGHDLDFQRMILADEDVGGVDGLAAMCGIMSGVWEGFYMMAEVAVTSPAAIGRERQQRAPDFICRKPLQCSFTEFVCFSNPNPDIPVVDDASGVRNLPKLSLETEGGFEFGGRRYERFTAGSDSHHNNCRERQAREPVDVVLLGETQEEHELAWGGFRFAGRIRKNGSIILKREVKEGTGEDVSGIWIFEGSVRFGTVFVGTWSPNSSNTNSTPAIQGIFSMQKRAKNFTSW